jgi:type II secretory pathway pseudopilin PulG
MQVMARSSRSGSAGFTYLGILLAVALLGIALAAVGTVWTTTLRREREAQLLFVGDAFRNAIASYYASGRQLPQELDELVEDKRVPLPRRHLRRIYLDPMTGRADWQLLRDPDGGIFGIASSSQLAPLKRANFREQDVEFEKAECYCEWQFEFNPTRGAGRRSGARALRSE